MSGFEWKSQQTLTDLFNGTATEETARKLADKAGERMTEIAKAETPVLTGETRDSIHEKPVVIVDEGGRRVYSSGAESSYYKARWLEHGVAPHLIPKRPGETVRFTDPGSGETVFARQVEHPGIEGHHAFAIAAAGTEADFERIAEPVLREWKHSMEKG